MRSPLKEGKDYYMNEKGLLVFTADYLKARGYCCGSGCQNCPYPLSGDVSAPPKAKGQGQNAGLKTKNNR
jgi:hypothetical protein